MQTNITGKSFKTYAARPRPEQGFPFWRYTGSINKITAMPLFGIKPENVTEVTCTITEQDICINERMKKKSTTPEYYGLYDYETKKVSLIQPSAIRFDMCFPTGADAACAGRKGTRTIVRLEIRETEQ